VSGILFANISWADNLFRSFYEYLAPLTPISPPDFRQLATISNLLSEEPLLTVTILYIVTLLFSYRPKTEKLAEPSHLVTNGCRALEVSRGRS